LADSQNGLDTGLNLEGQFATNRLENPLSAALKATLFAAKQQYFVSVI
jgi:hypothetical protein